MTYKAPRKHHTNGFVIRTYELSDAEQLAQQQKESYTHLKEAMPWASEHPSTQITLPAIRSFEKAYKSNKDYTLGIFDKDNKTLLGGTGFHLRGYDFRGETAEIGMWITASRSGEGLGTKVLKEMIKWGFYEWHWRRLSWYCGDRNLGSIRTAEKAGLVKEGLHHKHFRDHQGHWRDSHCFAITKRSSKDLDGPYAIRKLDIEDSLEMGAIHSDAWHDTYRGIIDDRELDAMSSKTRHQAWERIFEERGADQQLHGIFGAKKLLGIIGWGPTRDKSIPIDHEIYMINIPQDYQGNGLGNALMNKAIDELKKTASEVCLWVIKENTRAVNFYTKRGFEVTEHAKGEGRDSEVLMKINLAK